MAEDLLKGFRMGMDLGAPLVQAAMRKREFKMQAERDTIQNLRQSRERSLDRAAQQELEDIRQRGMDRRSDAQLKAQGDQLAESTRHNKEMESQSKDENDIRRAEMKLRKREARRKAKREQENDRPETEKLKEALLMQRREVADWTKKRDSAARLVRHYEHGNTDMMSPDEYEAAQARLEEANHNLAAIEDTRQIYASKMDVAMRAGDHKAIDSTIRSAFVQKPNQYGPIPFQAQQDAFGKVVRPDIVFNPNTGTTTVVPVPQMQAPPSGGGGNPGGLGFQGFGVQPQVQTQPPAPGGLGPSAGTPNPEGVPGGLGSHMGDAFWGQGGGVVDQSPGPRTVPRG